jgi:L-asparagine transporter-like permease
MEKILIFFRKKYQPLANFLEHKTGKSCYWFAFYIYLASVFVYLVVAVSTARSHSDWVWLGIGGFSSFLLFYLVTIVSKKKYEGKEPSEAAKIILCSFLFVAHVFLLFLLPFLLVFLFTLRKELFPYSIFYSIMECVAIGLLVCDKPPQKKKKENKQLKLKPILEG